MGNCPLSSVNRGTWLTKTSLYDLPANHSSRNELGSSNALVSTNGNGSPVGRQAGNYGFLVAKSLHANTPVACGLIDLLQRRRHTVVSSLPITKHISSLLENKLAPITFVTGPCPSQAFTRDNRSATIGTHKCVPMFFSRVGGNCVCCCCRCGPVLRCHCDGEKDR